MCTWRVVVVYVIFFNEKNNLIIAYAKAIRPKYREFSQWANPKDYAKLIKLDPTAPILANMLVTPFLDRWMRSRPLNILSETVNIFSHNILNP